MIHILVRAGIFIHTLDILNSAYPPGTKEPIHLLQDNLKSLAFLEIVSQSITLIPPIREYISNYFSTKHIRVRSLIAIVITG